MRRMTMKMTAVVATVGLAFGVAACGDDDDDKDESSSVTTPPAAEGASAEFGDAVVEFNSVVLEIDLEDDSPEEDIKAAGASAGPLSQAVVDSAPEDLADQAGALNDAIQPLNQGDAAPFNADETYEKYAAFVSDVVPACAFDEVDVVAVDYAFEDVPAAIEAGTIAFSLANESEAEEHEMVVFRRADGETRSFEELLELPEDETESAVVFKSAAFAPPGGTGSTLANLDAGEYAMVCFIPVGGAEGGAPHFTQGMLETFNVR